MAAPRRPRRLLDLMAFDFDDGDMEPEPLGWMMAVEEDEDWVPDNEDEQEVVGNRRRRPRLRRHARAVRGREAQPVETNATAGLRDLILEDCSCRFDDENINRGCRVISERCRTHPDDVYFGDARTGRTPLHEACYRGACLHTIEAILQVNSGRSMAMDEGSHTPLHMLLLACKLRSIEPAYLNAAIDLLLGTYASAVASMSNREANTSLHLACLTPPSMISTETIQRLLDASTSTAMRTNHYNRTPLACVCTQGRQASLKTARILIQTNAEALRVQDTPTGWTPLHHAAWNLADDLVQVLLEAEPTIAMTQSSQKLQTPLHVLCERHPSEVHLPAIRALLTTAPAAASVRDRTHSYTPLHLLCQGPRISVPVVRAFCEAVPQALSIPDVHRCLPLHHAVDVGVDPDAISSLIQAYPLATQALTVKQDSALSLACAANLSEETVRLLMEANAEALRLKNSYGFNALHCVLRAYQPDHGIVQALIQARPEIVTERTSAGESTLELAKSNPTISVAVLELLMTACRRFMADELVAPRTNQPSTDASNVRNTPLHFACFRRSPREEIERMAMANPEWVSVRNNAGYSPLQILTKAGRIDSSTITLFSRIGGPQVFSIADLTGNTPLHSAMRFETDVEALRALIRAYPEALHMKTTFDDTPLHLACFRRVSVEVIHEICVATSQGLETALASCNSRISPLLNKNTAGQTPISIAMEEYQRVCRESSTRVCCVQARYNAEQERSFEVLATLVKILHYGPVEDDDVPQSLVRACVSLHRSNIRVDPAFIRRALYVHPEEARWEDADGNFPVHIEASIPIEKMSLLDAPVQCECGGTCHQRFGILRTLFEIYPEAAKVRNHAGNFCLGLMIQNGRAWDSTLALAICTFPQAFHWIQGIDVKLMPDILARVGAECGLDTLYSLIQARPDMMPEPARQEADGENGMKTEAESNENE